MSSRLAGVRRLTLSCPDVILQPGQLSESAALRPGAAEIVQEMCLMGIEVFLISQVGSIDGHQDQRVRSIGGVESRGGISGG